MKIAVMQPYLFPYIGYFQLISSVDRFVLFDDVNYIKRGWINRNRILVNNTDFLFVIPVVGASQNKLIKDISITSDEKPKLLRTIEMAYKKAPYYSDVMPLINDIIRYEENNLSSFIYNSLLSLVSYLRIPTQIIKTASIYNNQELKGEDRIINICHLEKASHYLNPIGGLELYSAEKFREHGLAINFIKTSEITYEQFGKPFIPHLSIIDMLMFCGRERTIENLNKFDLI